MQNRILTASIFILYIANLLAINKPVQDIELGKIAWFRDLSVAQERSKLLKRPILILFQEVPGCSTCKNYGSQILSHPLIVESIENYFVPLCIHNNKAGNDKTALQFFKEPSWNNPVIRIVNCDLSPIVSRLNADYSAYGLISKINASLIVRGIQIPEYLLLLEEEFKMNAGGTQKATIGMYCFWSGEKIYGKLNGVVSTEAGFMNGSEVVTIDYNPNIMSLNELIKIGRKNNVADKLYDDSNNNNLNIPVHKPGVFKIDPETKYYLRQSDYKYIPMTPLQATRINSLLAEGKSCTPYLSPKQLLWYKKSKSIDKSKLKNVIGKDIIQCWYETVML